MLNKHDWFSRTWLLWRWDGKVKSLCWERVLQFFKHHVWMVPIMLLRKGYGWRHLEVINLSVREKKIQMQNKSVKAKLISLKLFSYLMVHFWPLFLSTFTLWKREKKLTSRKKSCLHCVQGLLNLLGLFLIFIIFSLPSCRLFIDTLALQSAFFWCVGVGKMRSWTFVHKSNVKSSGIAHLLRGLSLLPYPQLRGWGKGRRRGIKTAKAFLDCLLHFSCQCWMCNALWVKKK